MIMWSHKINIKIENGIKNSRKKKSHPGGASVWHSAPEQSMVLALNAQNGQLLGAERQNRHGSGVQRQKWHTNGRWTPKMATNLALNAQSCVQRHFTCLIGAGMQILDTPGSVDPTGSPPTSTHFFSPLSFTQPHKHSSPKALHQSPQTLFPITSSPLTSIHSSPKTYLINSTYLQNSKSISHPNPPYMAEPYPPLLHIFYFFFIYSFFSCSRASNILSLVW